MRAELGFRAFDPHELLPHVLAARMGLYESAGVEVQLRDLTFEQRPAIQVSCGSALFARLRDEPLRIVLVACRRPLFWLLTRDPQTRLDEARIASYPDGSPPAAFARLLLPAARLDPARDDDARIGLLLAGAVDAAVVSSAEPPARLERPGLHVALAFADALAIPTTGLAVPEPELDTEHVAALGGALRSALGVVQRDHDEVARALVDCFRYDPTSAETWARTHSTAFSADGTVGRAEAQAAIGLAAKLLGVAEPNVESVFAVTALS